MERGNKRHVRSSSSITADLFGTKESTKPSSSSTGIFATMFSTPSKTATGTKSSNSEVTNSWQKQLPPGIQASNTKQGSPAPHAEGTNCNIPNKNRSSSFHGERTEPCHLSSSLYYGGQDIYSDSPTTYTTKSSYPIFKKDGAAEDSNSNNSQDASRGNWWEGTTNEINYLVHRLMR